MSKTVEYAEIFQSVNYGLIVTDQNGAITHCNDQSREILGLDIQQYFGRDIAENFPLIGESAHKCLRTGQPIPEHQLVGKRARVILNVTPVRHGDEVIGTVCSFQELGSFETSAKKLDSYRTVNLQLQTIFNSSSDGIWVCDGQGTVISINQASEMLNGITKEDVIGRNISQLVASQVFDESVTSRVMATGKRQTVMQYVGRTGRHLLATGTPSIDGNGRIDLIVVNERDMTELNSLRERFEESRKIGEKYKAELTSLALKELKSKEIVAESPGMRQVLQTALKLAQIGASNILILGESGVGKGLLAKLIHQSSARKNNPFVEINCAALPEQLLEAELFGYEKGAFTGASDKGKVGLFELAQGGTIFLDEIGDMPLALQAKLLKYLDDLIIRRVGGTRSIKVECSTLAATNRNLPQLVRAGSFREDLYYRLKNFIIEIPPLRARPEDIPSLVRHYLHSFNNKYSVSRTIHPPAMGRISRYGFPGNVRELKNIIENAVVMSPDDQLGDYILGSIEDRHAFPAAAGKPAEDASPSLPEQLRNLERQLLQAARRQCRTTREMAQLLKISQPSIIRKLHQYGITDQLIQE